MDVPIQSQVVRVSRDVGHRQAVEACSVGFLAHWGEGLRPVWETLPLNFVGLVVQPMVVLPAVWVEGGPPVQVLRLAAAEGEHSC